MILAEISAELKKNRDLIPEVRFLLKKGKPAKKEGKKDNDKDLTLPRSYNKYGLIDKVRLVVPRSAPEHQPLRQPQVALPWPSPRGSPRLVLGTGSS